MKEPKYMVIYNHFRDHINREKYKIGDQLPTELEVSKHFGVSRLTANKALGILSDEGYVERISGKGTFVINDTIVKPLGRTQSFTDDMKKMGLVAGSVLVDFKVLTASDVPAIQKRLNLKDGDMIYYFVRKRTGNGLPIALSYTYLAAKYLPSFDINALNHSLYEYLRNNNVKIEGITCELSSVMSTEEQMKILDIKQTAMLKYAHVTYLRNRTAFEYIETFYIGSRYVYEFSTL